jgi:omega-6 fatty acid desaturase (delta-12 desaturase)
MDQQIKKDLKDWQKIVSKYKKPDNTKAIVQLLNSFLPFIGLWILMYFSLSWSYFITLGLAFINAFFLVRIFIIQHDCGHQSFLGKRKWNNRIGLICSFFSAIPYKYWAKVHSHHHGHTGQLDERDFGDINFLTVKEYQELPFSKKFAYRVFRSPFMLFCIVPIIYLCFSLRYPFHGKEMRGWKSIRHNLSWYNLLFAAVFVACGFLIGWSSFLMVHLPIVYFFGVIAFWFFYIQHQHEETYQHWKENWDFLLASIKGASYYKLPKIFQWLTGNIGFHHIHHLSSKIPNYNLEKCAEENPILQKYVTVLTFKESLKIIFNKLWDEETNRMISFREYEQLKKSREAA